MKTITMSSAVLMLLFACNEMAVGNEIVRSRAKGAAGRTKRIFKANFRIDFQRPERSRMRVQVDTESTNQSTRDSIRQQIVDDVNGFTSAPSFSQIKSVLDKLHALIGTFNSNEVPGDASDLLKKMENLYAQFDGLAEEGDLESVLVRVGSLTPGASSDQNSGSFDQDEIVGEVNASVDEISTLMAKFGEEFPELVNALMDKIQAAINTFNSNFPDEVNLLVANINKAIEEFNADEVPDFSDGVPDNFEAILDDYIEGQVSDGLDDLQTKLKTLINTFHQNTLPTLLDGLIGSIKSTIDEFVQTELPQFMDTFFSELKSIMQTWGQSTAFDLESGEAANGKVLTVHVNGTEFTGTFDEKGLLETDVMKGKLSGNAEKLRLDLNGAKLLEALGLDATKNMKNQNIDIPIEISIAELAGKSGYRVGELPTHIILIDQGVPFKIKQKAQTKSIGRN